MLFTNEKWRLFYGIPIQSIRNSQFNQAMWYLSQKCNPINYKLTNFIMKNGVCKGSYQNLLYNLMQNLTKNRRLSNFYRRIRGIEPKCNPQIIEFRRL